MIFGIYILLLSLAKQHKLIFLAHMLEAFFRIAEFGRHLHFRVFPSPRILTIFTSDS
jgi:hypothetical protein